MPGDHFYTLDFQGELAPGNYEREGITGYVYASRQPGTVTCYRWYSETTHDHFYTTDSTGELAPELRMEYEGIAWYMFLDRHVNNVPLYRWFNRGIGDHLYSTSPNSESLTDYTLEGIKGYIHANKVPQSTELYRWYESGLLSNFTFSSDISPARKRKLLERHTWAYYRAGICGSLDNNERKAVREVYRKPIRHEKSTEAGINAKVPGLKQDPIFINFSNLFPDGDDEIAQTLLHEMMHVAGYSHPKKKDTDEPFDGGKYFNSAPLRAELCINGDQSDAGNSTVHRVLAADASEADDATKTSVRACPVFTEEEQAAAAGSGSVTADADESAAEPDKPAEEADKPAEEADK